MRKNTFISILVLLAFAFLWSCEEEIATPTDEGISLRHHKDDHDQGGGNGDDGDVGNGNSGKGVVYELSYQGILTNAPAHGVETANSPKWDKLETFPCGGPFELDGIPDLLASESTPSRTQCHLLKTQIRHKCNNK